MVARPAPPPILGVSGGTGLCCALNNRGGEWNFRETTRGSAAPLTGREVRGVPKGANASPAHRLNGSLCDLMAWVTSGR